MFLYTILFYIIGVLIDSLYINNWFIVFYCISLALLIYYLLKYKNKSIFFAFICLFFLIFGAFISSIYKNFNFTKLLNQPIKNTYVYGKIYKIEESQFEKKFNIYIKDIVFNSSIDDNTILPSTIKITYNKDTDAEINDIIKVRLFIFPPSKPILPNGFNFEKNAFFNKVGANAFAIGDLDVIEKEENDSILSKIKNKILQIQNNIQNYLVEQIKDHVNPKIAPFVASIALGEYDFLPENDLNNLRNSGLAHLISISGYHITILSGFIFFIFRILITLIPKINLMFDGKKIASILTICFLLFYMFIVGNHTPAIRASIMSISLFLAFILNFNALSVNSLFVAIFIILIFNPFAIYNAGFLLSCVSTLVIIVFANSTIFKKISQFEFNFLISKYLYKITIFILASILLTLFIEIAISPILGFYFGTIPAFGIVANMLAAPIFSFLLMPSLLGFLILPNFIAKYFLYISEFSTKIILNIADYFANLYINDNKISLIYINFIPNYLLVLYLIFLVIFCIFYTNKINIFNSSLLKKLVFISPLFGIFLIIFIYFNLPKHPDIIIDYDATLIAYKYGEESNEYTFSNTGNNFIKNNWLKNNNIVFNNIFNNNIYLKCNNDNCFTIKNNYKISFLNNTIEFEDACLESNLIIMTINKPFNCETAEVIDKEFLKNHGSTTIYLQNKIKIISNN